MDAERVVAAVLVRKPLESVWECWTDPADMEEWDSRRNYEKVVPLRAISYVFSDGRKGCVEFQHIDRNTIIRESFEPDPGISLERQRESCQAGLDRFREYMELL